MSSITLKFTDGYSMETSQDELVEKTSLPVGDDDILELPWSPGLGWALQYVMELRGLAPDDVENNCEEKWEDYCALPQRAKMLILDVEEHFYFKYRQFTIRSLQHKKGWVYPPETRPSWRRIYDLINNTAQAILMTGHRGVLDILTKYCGKRMNFRGQMFIHAIQWAHFPVMDYLRETWDDFPEFGYRENLMRWVNIARSGGKQPVIDYLEDMQKRKQGDFV